MILILNSIKPTAELLALKKENRNYPLAITSGCFDILHPGHLYFFHTLRQQLPVECKLLVALHTDADIRKYKGSDRPVFPEHERLAILNELKSIDFVGIWPIWETIYQIADFLQPDYLATTTDYSEKPQWENSWTKVAERNSARLILINREPDAKSTSNLISQIKNG